MKLILLIIGFILLIKGAELFVEGASSIARKFKVPTMIIGLTIVAMGTSTPEAAVSITSSLAGQNDMCVANVVGSNFFNILIVLGVSAILAKLPVEENTIKKDTPFLILASFLLLVLSFGMEITRIEGLIFLAFFVYFLIYTIKGAKDINESTLGDTTTIEESETSENISMVKTVVISIIGIVCIVFGGDMVVDSATNIATSFGMSTNLVGLTIVAVGTSLPEFVTSVIAVKKGETEIAIGNVIGSNIFNILFILGLSAVISPITISSFALIDELFMTIITILLYLFMKKEKYLIKTQGYIFIGIYIAYMAYTIIR